MRLYAVAVMLVLGFIATMSFTQHIPTAMPAVQENLYANVPTVEPGPPPRAVGVKKGEALAYMRIPRFGKDWLWTVSEGTSMRILDNGPGHFIGTALPGEEGNSAYAAHRAGNGDPFIDFDTLKVGDEVVLAQNGGEWTYKITMEPEIIAPNDLWVIEEVDEPGKWLTLTTCWPKYGAEKRMYVRALLEG